MSYPLPNHLSLSIWLLILGTNLTLVEPSKLYAAGGTTIARAVTNYFGKDSATEAAQWMAKKGGAEAAERLTKKATSEGGEATVEQVATLAGKYGPDAVRSLDNAPVLRPVLGAIDQLSDNQVGAALTRLGAGQQGKELAETVSRFGVGALRAELKHPGVGVRFASSLGDEGIMLAEKLTTDQAIAIGRHVDDIAKLPPVQRSEIVRMISEQSERFTDFAGGFVKQNPGTTLFTLSGTALVLANKDAIFGGDEIVFDKDGNPVLMSKQGMVERAASRATGEISERVVSPVVQIFVPLAATLIAGFFGIKLYGVWKRQQSALANRQDPPNNAT